MFGRLGHEKEAVMDGAYFKAYRPSNVAPQREDEFETERRKMRESRIEQYAILAQKRLPLFQDFPVKKGA